jgi:hypothetical protein
VFALDAPFRVAPPEVGAINAAAPLLSDDGATLTVFHVVYRQAFNVALGSHQVSLVNTDSLNRSVTAAARTHTGLWVQCATFDQTMPVFRWDGGASASFVAELPLGLNQGAVASDGSRVYVVRGGGLGGPPLAADGGLPFPFPGGGDGGLPGGFPGLGDGGLPPFPSGGALSVEVFRLSPEVLR